MEKHNIIFLDLDGVVNSQLFYKKRHELNQRELEFDKDAFELINEFIDEYNCKVVISSTHRADGIDKLQKKLNSYGFKHDIFGITGGSKCRIRGYEIKNWISENIDIIKNYVIFDDDSDMLLYQAKHFFRCDTYTGITPNILYRAGRFLDGKL